MLGATERKILEFLFSRHLTTKGEIISQCSAESNDGVDVSIGRLMDSGFIDKVESLGTCFVITQKGIREMKGKSVAGKAKL
jgi:predicted transcriptional regulator